ncbi:acyl-CoA synthetase [Aldersonia sp. NBC_00410]|uniref:acyl-CoA synthetase n=1 Tax=Aldersonia sp. NBC_00410 TaxID=2975954 RepID=UPI0022555234|nr:acyl-CoA synthetase [Aldersonia sp. NBC_00410]MCX5045369.1 acyl-CoA synthetase [Aldersonia sp. NBC_00410]
MSNLTSSADLGAREFNIPTIADLVAAAIPDREFIAFRGRHHTYADVVDRSRRLASYLHSRDLGCRTERSELAGHEVGQDLLGIYAYNGNEYVESMLGSFRARVAPFNVNYRYVKNELQYLLADSGATALVYHAAFAPRLAEVLPDLPNLRVLIQIADDSGNPLLDGAVDYETVIADSAPEPPVQPTPDDLYVLYTGGTTGMPKGVLWRQHDIFMGACGGKALDSGDAVASYEEIVAKAVANPGMRIMVLPPLIHGAAQWAALTALTSGQTLVFSPVTDHFDTDAVLATIEAERPAVVTTVGDAVARPLAAALSGTDADTSSLILIANGGAILSPTVKEQLIAALPNAIVLDGVGSSETGYQMTHMSVNGAVSTGKFTGSTDTRVVSEDKDAVLGPGHDGIGWLAQRGFVPLGYKGDETKTAATFPVIDGIRYSLPGDRACLLDDGSVQLLGRDSVTINSGGEKVFVEEVEMVLASHPAVADVVVAGRPSSQWGEEVVAIVALADDTTADGAELIEHAGRSLARYKLPKEVLFRPAIERSPVGKADYRWAREQAAASAE